jgi:PAS domain S-box-containing protein
MVMKRAEERFYLAVESAPNTILMSDRAGKIVFVNAQTEELFGYSRGELLGQPVEILVPEPSRDITGGSIRHFYRNHRGDRWGGGRELYGRSKDGTLIPVEVGLSQIKTVEGTLVIPGSGVKTRLLGLERFQLAGPNEYRLGEALYHR